MKDEKFFLICRTVFFSVLGVTILITFIAMLAESIEVCEKGNYCLSYNNQKIAYFDKLYLEGRHYVGYYNDLTQLSRKQKVLTISGNPDHFLSSSEVQENKYEDYLEIRTRDGMSNRIALTIHYHYGTDPGYSGSKKTLKEIQNIKDRFGFDEITRVIYLLTLGVTHGVFKEYEAAELILKRAELSDSVHKNLAYELSKMGIGLSKVCIRDIRISDRYQSALTQTLIIKQYQEFYQYFKAVAEVQGETSVMVATVAEEITVEKAKARGAELEIVKTAEAQADEASINKLEEALLYIQALYPEAFSKASDFNSFFTLRLAEHQIEQGTEISLFLDNPLF